MDRRKLLGLLGVAGFNLLGGYASAHAGDRKKAEKMFSCVATPQQTEGPYFIDEQLYRSDIRSDPSDGSVKDGLPLTLEIRTFAMAGDGESGCSPLADAIVDIWHCDAQGVYSDVRDRSFDTVGKKFLRGYQVTAADGSVRFTTIYPGWYPGRSVHIHFKIRTHPKYGRVHEFTSQLYFDDSITDQVHAQEPYSRHPAQTKKELDGVRTRNEEDAIFRKGGDQLMLKLAEADRGYAASFKVGVEFA